MARISEYLKKIRTSIYGKDVRGSLADGLEEVNKETIIATEVTEKTEFRQGTLEQQFDDQIANMTLEDPSSAELVAARTNTETGEEFNTVGRRLNAENEKVTKQQLNTTKDLELRSFNIRTPPFPLSPAIGDNVADDILAIKNIMQVMEDGDTLFFPKGRFRATLPLALAKNINVVMHGLLVSDHDKEAIIVDNLGISTAFIPELKLKVFKKNINFNDESVGVLVKNSYNAKMRFDYVGNFSTGILFTAEGNRGTVYNEISLGQIYNNKIQIHITAKDPSWANQNNFFGGRLYYATGDTREGFVQIKIDGASDGVDFYGCNGNNFFGTSIEDVGVGGKFAKAAIINGHSNHFFAPRTEGSMIWEFGESSFRNKLDGGTYVTMNNIIDKGTFNSFDTQGTGSSQATQATYHSHKFIAGANNTVGLEATGDGANRIPARFWNEGAPGYPAVQIMERDGVTVAGEFKANGAWIVRGGNRSVFWGVHLGAPTSGTYRNGDLSFVTNPSLGDPIGYVCVTSGSPGTWRAFGQIGAKPSITSPPDYAGQTAVVSGVGYMATGTTSSADWKRIT